MNTRFVILTTLFGGLLAGCMSLEKMYISPETQAIVQSKVEMRDYVIAYLIKESSFYFEVDGFFHVAGDSLYIQTRRGTIVNEESYRIANYRQEKTERGATVINFSAIKRNKEGKDVFVPCRILIYAVDKIELYINEVKYHAKFDSLAPYK